MAVKLGLWSLTLIPGEKYPLYVKRDFTITNAALSDDLASSTGRSVLKVTHNPVNPAIYDSDSEIDSDDEDMMDDMPEEDEFELDEVEGFKEVEKAKKVNGDAEMKEDDDEEDEDEDDEEDDDDFSDDEVEVTNVICALTAGKIEQATIDLTFTQGEAVMFEITGENAVHLMGNYIMQPNPFDDESDDEHDHDDYDEMYDDEDESEDDEEMAAFIEELKEKDEPKKKAITASTTVETAKPKKTSTPAAAAAPTPVVADKKRKAEAIESPASKAAPTAASAVAGENLSKAQKKKLAKKAKTEGSDASAAVSAKPAAAPAAGGQKRTTPSGLVIEDIKKGDGPVAKGGKRLSMRYIGKLTSGKQFDANTAGKPFSFVLGRGEVIKGWDEGLMGMAVGGERRLTIPAPLAYGSQAIPGIPKNSTLKFDVKLLAVN